MNWQKHYEELRAGERWQCPKCDLEHTTHWRVVRIERGKNYQLWKGPHMICSGDSAQGLQDYAENEFNEGDFF